MLFAIHHHCLWHGTVNKAATETNLLCVGGGRDKMSINVVIYTMYVEPITEVWAGKLIHVDSIRQ